MSEEDRNSLLRNLDPNQRHDILNVLSSMPKITITHRVEVQDDEDKQTITAGALVTVFVNMKREPLMRMDASGSSAASTSSGSGGLEHGEDGQGGDLDEYDIVQERLEDDDEESVPNGTLPGDENAPQQPKKRVWEKATKKKKGGKAPAAKNKKKTAPPKGVVIKKGGAETAVVAPKGSKLAQGDTSSIATDSPRTLRDKSQNPSAEASKNNSDSESDNSDAESVSDSDVDDAIREKESQDVDRDIMEAEEDDMTFDDDIMKKERLLETKSKITHPVHCPYFPADKYEWWWVYLTDKRRSGDKKRTNLITSPAYVTSLIDEEDIELKFAAPPVPGQYAFQLCLRSDSYLDCDQVKDFKIQVHPAREITSHPQWDFPSEDDEKAGSDGSASEGSDYTEEEVDEDD